MNSLRREKPLQEPSILPAKAGKPIALFFGTNSANKDKDFCEVVEFFSESFKVHVITSSTPSATQVDNLLWQFSKESFVPHKILSPGEKVDGLPERVFITVGNVFISNCQVVAVYDGVFYENFYEHYLLGLTFVLSDREEQRKASGELWKALGAKKIERFYFPAEKRNEWFSELRRLMNERGIL